MEDRVLRDDDAMFAYGNLLNLGIGRAIRLGQIEGVQCIVASVAQAVGQSVRQMRVNQKIHALTGSIRLT